MKLTRKAFMEKGAEVSAKRAADFDKLIAEKGDSSSAKMLPALMVLMNAVTINKLADNIGLTNEENEVDVTEDAFDRIDALSASLGQAKEAFIVLILMTFMLMGLPSFLRLTSTIISRSQSPI